jgi:hypothetical protein
MRFAPNLNMENCVGITEPVSVSFATKYKSIYPSAWLSSNENPLFIVPHVQKQDWR